MKTPFSLPFIPAMVVILMLLSGQCFFFPAHADANLMIQTCKRTPFSRLCFSTLQSNPQSSGEDVAGLGLIIVHAVEAKAGEASRAIKRLQRSNPQLKEALSKCAQDYSIILSAFIPEANQALRGDPKFAEDGMSGTASSAQGCEDSFPHAKSPLTGLNRPVHDLSLVAISIIRTLL